MTLFFEDLSAGDERTSGEYEVTATEIIDFAEQYDPQWFHLDADRAADESMYGGLIASGFHTASMSMRLLVDSFLNDAATLGAKGVDTLRWHKPVRPGDVLSVRTEILECEIETDRRGVVRAKVETETRDGEVVFSMIGLVMFARRNN